MNNMENKLLHKGDMNYNESTAQQLAFAYLRWEWWLF